MRYHLAKKYVAAGADGLKLMLLVRNTLGRARNLVSREKMNWVNFELQTQRFLNETLL